MAPPSPQPADMPRTMVLMGPTAQLASSEYSATWFTQILVAWPKAIGMDDASSITAKERVVIILKIYLIRSSKDSNEDL